MEEFPSRGDGSEETQRQKAGEQKELWMVVRERIVNEGKEGNERPVCPVTESGILPRRK